jgi:hypothetical protein
MFMEANEHSLRIISGGALCVGARFKIPQRLY